MTIAAASTRRPLVSSCALALCLALAPTACDEDSGGGASDETGGGGEGGDPSLGEVPGDPAYCAAVVDWDPAAAQLEQDVLAIVNQRRAEGADCGAEGSFAPAPPLAMNGRLRCAARNHSADMVARSYFDHYSPEGASPGDRVDAAEYAWSTWGENIAGGSADAAGTMDQWMSSDGHCSNIMSPGYTELGVGYAAGGEYGHTWTQVFGAPL